MRLAACAVQIGRPESWPSWVPPGHRRRADPLTRIAVAAIDRLSKGGWRTQQDTALVVSTSYGAVEATWRFGVSILDSGDAAASPTPFTSSVHNSIAGAIGESLALHGPCTTLSQGQHGTCAALRWAQGILASGRSREVLVVLGDCHNDWSRAVVSELIGGRFPVGDGAIALICRDDIGPGRSVEDHSRDDALQIEAGCIAEEDRALLATWTGERRETASRIGTWWPCAALAQMDDTLWHSDRPLRIAEAEDGRLDVVHLGPWREA